MVKLRGDEHWQEPDFWPNDIDKRKKEKRLVNLVTVGLIIFIIGSLVYLIA